MSEKVAALFVETGGVYFSRPDVDPWDRARDARGYAGPHPVVAHPPCERWGRYWSGGPSAKVRRELGDDDGCFAAALRAVCDYGGVLEHPEASHAFTRFGIRRPRRDAGGWERAWLPQLAELPRLGSQAYVCCVEQNHYGHRARKKTWLLFVGGSPPPPLIWGPSKGERLDEGFHSKEERARARAAGIAPRPRLSKRENIATPPAFAELLITLAKSALP